MLDTVALLSDVGGGEMIIVGIVALLLFGRNLPTQARNIGKAIGEFKRTLSEAKTEITKEMDNAAREVEKAAADAKIKESLADIDRSISDDPGPKLDMPPPSTPVLVAAPEKPMGLDAPSAGSASVSTTDNLRAPGAVSGAAALDNLERNIPAPKNIPPPI